MRLENDECGVTIKVRLHISAEDVNLIKLLASAGRIHALRFLERIHPGLEHGTYVQIIKALT